MPSKFGPRGRACPGRSRNEKEVIPLTPQAKLLIVDDELSVRDSLAKWFHEEGYEVGTAEDANGALTRMAEKQLGRCAGRHQDARHRRHRTAAPHARDRSQSDRHHDDRLCFGRDRGHRAEERRLRLRHQAARSGRDRAPGEEGARAQTDRGRKRPPARDRRRGGAPGGHHRAERGHAEGLSRHRDRRRRPTPPC